MTSDTSRRPRVVVAEDDAVLRYTIKLIIEKHYEVIGEAQDGAAAVELTDELRPDVVLLDISMPVMTGFAAARLIRERLPDVRVIIVRRLKNQHRQNVVVHSYAAIPRS